MDNSIKKFKQIQKIFLLENSLHKTGAFNAALLSAKALRSTYDIEFILPTESILFDEVVASGFLCHRLPTIEIGKSLHKLFLYLPTLFVNAIRLILLLNRKNADGLIVNDYYNLLGVCIRILGWRGKILTMVQLLPDSQFPLTNIIWTRLGLLFTSKFLAVSESVARQLPSHPKVAVIYNPVCYIEKYKTSFFPPYSNEDLVHCLYPANYISGKGHEKALYAFAQALQVHSSLRMRFVGSDMGLKKNRFLKCRLQLLCYELNLHQFVSVDDFSNDIELDIKNSDIILNFSESESFSMTCAEASAYGRPIIATRCGGPEEIVIDEVTGLLVEVDNVQTMADAILKLARSKALRQQFGRAGYHSVRNKFTEENFRVSFNKVWNSII